MKKYVLIFAKNAHSKTPYDVWLKGTDITPIILTSSEFLESYSHLDQVFGFSHYDQNLVVEKRALELAETFKPIAIFARAEADILRAARVRQACKISGQTLLSALTYRNKFIMKESLQGTGVKTPKYALIDSVQTIRSFIAENQFPVVIKPLSESGSSGVQIVRNNEELEIYLTQPYRGETQIESYVEGAMHHVDGLVIDGELKFIHAFRYINDCLAYRENQFTGSWALEPNNPALDSLLNETKKVLTALPSPKNMAFHAELWVQDNGEIVFCEIASRTGGGMISHSIEYCFDLNLDREWFYAECGIKNKFEISALRSGGSVVIPPQVGLLESLPTTPPPAYVLQQVFTGAPGIRYQGGVKSGLFLAGYVVKGDNEQTVKNNMIQTAQWFEQNSKWQGVAV